MSIGTLLVANRGEIASRILRTARERGLRTVVVFSDADENAPHVRHADVAVRLPGATPQETYLAIPRIIEAAQRTGADAIHPGYGFLSENADFARACADAGITFVGPPVTAIEAMGSKVTAKSLMEQAGVPVLPSVTVSDDDMAGLPAKVQEEIGFPALVKASFGGGGRGMRIVHSSAELEDAVAGARREAESAFGDGTVFVERYVEAPRHIEVQIFGDQFGNVTSLFERECSIQRRYQKIIEEAPSPAVDDELRAHLSAAAVAAGNAIGYVGAGTVEFILDQDRNFYFLEVNTRLQVEHPVTEMITRLDLVDLQLRVADGERLPAEVQNATIEGHAVEVRLYAEDVPAGFLPASGPIHRFHFPTAHGLRVDAGVEDGSTVSVHYDSMIAKVIAHAGDRERACARLARALSTAQLHGVVTNRDLLVRILQEPEFLAGKTDTAYLERHDPKLLGAPLDDPEAVRLHALAASLVGQYDRRRDAAVATTIPTGWRNVRNQPQRTLLRWGDSELVVEYEIRGDRVAGAVDGAAVELVMSDLGESGITLEEGHVRRRFHVHRVAGAAFVDSALGSSTFGEPPRLPLAGDLVDVGSLLAPMPATVIRVAASIGDHVDAGQPVVVLEAMKMEHTVEAPHAGQVSEVRVQVGQQVDGGVVLAVIEEDEGDQ